MAYTTPSTVGGSDVLTAALWNTQIRDNFESMPRGALGRAQVTVPQSVSSDADVTGLTVTWSATSNRLYLTTVKLHVLTGGINSLVTASITDTTPTRKQFARANIIAISYFDFYISFYETGLSGSTTRKVRLESSSSTVSSQPSALNPNQIIVQDMGLA